MKHNSARTQLQYIHRGVLSIEMVIILAVIAIMTVYIFSNSGSLFGKHDVVRETGNIQEIITNARLYLKNDGKYPADIQKDLIAIKGIPSSMTVSSNKITHTWGGEIKITSANPFTSFNISYDNMPTDACIQMVTKLARNGDSIGTLEISGQLAVATKPTTAFNTKVVNNISTTKVAELCSKGGDKNTIIMKDIK